MSQISVSSPKHCAKKGISIDKRHKKLFFTFSSLFTTLLFIILLFWLILHPEKPEFSLTEIDIYQLNLSGTHLLNSSIQLTLVSKNPNKKVGIYYDKLQAYVAYRAEQITSDAYLPPFYQGHEEKNLLTAFLQGTELPVASSFVYGVARDQIAGQLVLNLKLDGKLRWKIGTWVSGQYRFDVNCVTVVAFGPYMSTGLLASRQGTQCSTNL